MQRLIPFFVALVSCVAGSAAETADSVVSAEKNWRQYLPEINGTFRGRYELDAENGAGRFAVRTMRVSVKGSVIPRLDYFAEIDLCDEGAIKMMDAYGRFNIPRPDMKVQIGQFRMPFGLDVHRGPQSQYFANRSFIAKTMVNMRDVGLKVEYGVHAGVPVSLMASVFNCSGLTRQKDYWTKRYGYSFKAQVKPLPSVLAEVSYISFHKGGRRMNAIDAGACWEGYGWHVEGEYIHKIYCHDAFGNVDGCNFFTAKKFPLKGKVVNGISALARYDYMGNHSTGIAGDDGGLLIESPERHRLTVGSTLSLGRGKHYAEVRLNYEQYFHKEGVVLPVSEGNKMVAELMVRF